MKNVARKISCEELVRFARTTPDAQNSVSEISQMTTVFLYLMAAKSGLSSPIYTHTHREKKREKEEKRKIK